MDPYKVVLTPCTAVYSTHPTVPSCCILLYSL
uniref:Uncharacterized protein n=1 Tax=Rhizophora mucronata TaxID=61149 RepID=A0A2P2PAY0_RHIMU